MMTVPHSWEILASIETLNAVQRARVLAYIRGLVGGHQDEDRHERLKRQAMIEIRRALKRPVYE